MLAGLSCVLPTPTWDQPFRFFTKAVGKVRQAKVIAVVVAAGLVLVLVFIGAGEASRTATPVFAAEATRREERWQLALACDGQWLLVRSTNCALLAACLLLGQCRGSILSPPLLLLLLLLLYSLHY